MDSYLDTPVVVFNSTNDSGYYLTEAVLLIFPSRRTTISTVPADSITDEFVQAKLRIGFSAAAIPSVVIDFANYKQQF